MRGFRRFGVASSNFYNFYLNFFKTQARRNSKNILSMIFSKIFNWFRKNRA